MSDADEPNGGGGERRRRRITANVDDVAEQAELTATYVTFMALAGVLAGVGLVSNSMPVLIGSMIIAPALPPFALVAFALVDGRPRLAARGLGVGLLGVLIATAAAVCITWLMNVTDVIPAHTNLLHRPMLEERVRPGWWSLAAAFAGGIVGVVALSQKKMDTLVGTVAALALVPAGAATGIAVLSGDMDRAAGGLLLLGMNVGLIVAMGLVTLLLTAAIGWGRRAGLLLLAAAIIAVVCALLWWAQQSGRVQRNPPEVHTSSIARSAAAKGCFWSAAPTRC